MSCIFFATTSWWIKIYIPHPRGGNRKNARSVKFDRRAVKTRRFWRLSAQYTTKQQQWLSCRSYTPFTRCNRLSKKCPAGCTTGWTNGWTTGRIV